MLAWRFYCEDNNDKLPSAYQNAGDWWPFEEMSRTGNPTTDGQNQFNWNPDVTVKQCNLYPYSGNAAVFRCPGDAKWSCLAPSGTYQGQSLPRVRSYSMISWFNGQDAAEANGSSGFTVYKKLSQVLNPGPALTIVFMDERMDSINDGELYTSMSGFDPSQPGVWEIADLPSNYHGGSGSAAFADGHSEIHKWVDRVRNARIPWSYNESTPNSRDTYWIMFHATRKP
jgi:prepilin-type processing-associated H-X9-DG protein